MLVILDHDETYTKAPDIWDAFIVSVMEKGHSIICCTYRMDDGFNDDVEENMGKHGLQIVYAASFPDKWSAVLEAGFNPENAIWIDDCPQFILLGG